MFVMMLVFRAVKQEEGHAHKIHCSRERSRAAWQAIEEVTGIILLMCILRLTACGDIICVAFVVMFFVLPCGVVCDAICGTGEVSDFE